MIKYKRLFLYINRSLQATKWIDPLITLDKRSIAVFRIGLALHVIIDTIIKIFNADLYYGEGGVAPLEEMLKISGNLAGTPYALSQSDYWVYALLLTQLFVSMALLIGYRSRLMASLVWFLLISLHYRNNLILNGGDVLFRVILLWSIFLPLGERLTVFKNAHQGKENDFRSLLVLPSLLQIGLMYFVTGVAKLEEDIWQSGNALIVVFSNEQFTSSMADVIIRFPNLLIGMTYFTLIIQLCCLPLLFSPIWTKWTRFLLAITFIIFHLSIALFMNVGLFSFTCVIMWLVCIPSLYWDYCAKKIGWNFALLKPIKTYSCERYVFMFFTVPALTIAVIVMVASVLIDLKDVSTTPGWMRDIKSAYRIRSSWAMFKAPAKGVKWHVIRGRLADRSYVELISQTPFVDAKPTDFTQYYSSESLRKLAIQLNRDSRQALREPFVNYYINKWRDRYPDKKLIQVELIYYYSKNKPTVDEYKDSYRRGVYPRYELAGHVLFAKHFNSKPLPFGL